MMIISQFQGRASTWSFLSVDDSETNSWWWPHTHGSCHGVNTVLSPTQLIVNTIQTSLSRSQLCHGSRVHTISIPAQQPMRMLIWPSWTLTTQERKQNMKHLWCLLEPELRSVNCKAQSGGVYPPSHPVVTPHSFNQYTPCWTYAGLYTDYYTRN